MRTHVPETAVQTLRVNGLDLAYLEAGEGPLALLFHGFPDTAHTWDDLRPRIAALGYRVVTPFLRGYAPSASPPDDDYGAETLGQDVLGWIEALGADQAVVVGHDWGAMAAYSAASLDPSRVSKLVTVAIPHPNTLALNPIKLWGARHFLTLRLPGATGRFAANDFASVRTMYERWSPAHDWPESEFESVKNAFAAPDGAHAALGYYRCLTPAPPAFLREKIRVPSWVIGGESDGVATA
ncbi:MAG: pimeloyl-ACP methyl ester carboxylesterase, partial [Myxococcota bacterium]